VAFPEPYKSEMLLQNLDIRGIAVSGGSACSSGAVGESHVLKAIDANPDAPTIRFSLSKFNTNDEIDDTIEALKKILL
jgi:cysteine desulfurase